MGSFLSSFTLYEIFRILLPGIYVVALTSHAGNLLKWKDAVIMTGEEVFSIMVIFSVLAGCIIYMMDIPRVFRKMLDDLPSNVLKKKYPEFKDKNDRVIENEYNKFYYKLKSDSKIKTEIHSGLYHLFINFAAASLLVLFVYSYLGCNGTHSIWGNVNIAVLIFCIVSAIIIYKRKLRYSWRRNIEEYDKWYVKKNNKENTGLKNE